MLIRATNSYFIMRKEELCRCRSILHNGEDKFVQFPGSGEVPSSYEIKFELIVQPMRLIFRGTTCYETKDEPKVIYETKGLLGTIDISRGLSWDL
ncbi:BgTH12-02244 [Blumeria graminis f. sp. triticale]|uniref:BgTH12-02244 n=1 Tax=Blumeria graminis f. sp. triticale TaxID=1689686 RepID=A0A9W4DLB8_BLUGR|nr:BgTH12-02244 [Blumeria graminis f. sp. triticale]